MRQAALAAVAGFGIAAGLGAQTAPSIARVEVHADVPIDRGEIEPLIDLLPGEPYDERAARDTLRNLYATGIVSEVEIWTMSEAEGDGAITVHLALVGSVRVSAIVIEGEDLGLRREELLAVVSQREGEPLLEDRVLRSLAQLRDLLAERGYLTATVRLRVDTVAATKSALVAFEVAAGPRATLSAIEFGGEPGPALPDSVSRQELISGLDLKPGDRYAQNDAIEAGERLERRLRRQGWVTAAVSAPLVEPAADRRTVALRYPLTVGPKLVFSLRGAERRALEKKDLLPFLGDEGYDEASVLQAVERIRRHYQELGHYGVVIEREEEIGPEEIRLEITIVPGPVLPLEAIAFTGNASFSEDRLAELISTSRRRAFSRTSGHLVDEVLEEDLANLRSFYALEGFGQARVGPPHIENDGQALRLTIPIEEGVRARVEELTIDGAVTLTDRLEARDLPALLPLRVGGPYHPLLVQGAIDALRALYEDAGYEGTQVSATVSWRADPLAGTAPGEPPAAEQRTRAVVGLRIFEGSPIVVDRVLVRGRRRTRPEVIARAVGIERGDRASSVRLLEAQRRLYGLGLFSRVEIGFSRGGEEAGRRDVLVRLVEGRTQRFTYSLGYESEEGPRGLLGYSHSNLFGRALRFQLDARVSEMSEQFRALLFQPYAWGLPVQVNHTLFSLEEERESFRSDQIGTQIQADREWSRDRGQIRAGLLYTFRIVDLELNPDVPIDEDEITREQRDIQISSFTPSLLVDRRDDPIDPTRGWTAAFQVEEAFELASADEKFTKFFVQGTRLTPLGRAGILAASLRFGAIQSRADSGVPDPTLPPRLPAREVPISERFFGGGRTTHRAYGRDELGIRGQTLCRANVDPETAALCRSDLEGGDAFFSAGGNGLALLNVDYRFPIVGDIGGVLFADAGNVWGDWRDVDAGTAKWGAGVGLRYRSPIGPLRAEIGWKLDREPGESAYEIRLSFGNPF